MAQRMDVTDASSANDLALAVPSHNLSDPTGNKPTCIVCLGMAGSGKTTFMQVSSCNCGFVFHLYFRESVLIFTPKIALHTALILIQQSIKYPFLLISVCACVCVCVCACVWCILVFMCVFSVCLVYVYAYVCMHALSMSIAKCLYY